MNSLDFMNLLVGWHYDGSKNLSQAGMQVLKKMIIHQDSGLAMLDFAKSRKNLTDYDYWCLLGILYIHGGYWSFMSPNLWRLLLNSSRSQRNMIMQPFERRALKNLPEKVVCYRIHHSKEEHDWISYTISSWLIPKFVKAYRKHDAFYSVEKFEVAKQDIDFFFGRNYEDEIVVLDRSKVKKTKEVNNDRIIRFRKFREVN